MPADGFPYCTPACENWPKANCKPAEDLRGVWLCPVCGRPPEKIFMHTDRWEIERDLWQLQKGFR